MAQKCLNCKAPLTGFFAKIAALAGVRQSTVNPDYCNKCEAKAPQAVKPVAPVATPATESTPVQPAAEVKLPQGEPEDILDGTDNKPQA